MRLRVLLALTLAWPLFGATQLRAAQSGQVTLRIWYATNDPVERVWSQELARRFEATHRSITVQLTGYRFDDLNALSHEFSASSAPDLAYVTPRQPGIPTYAHSHALADLTAAAISHHWFSALRPGLLSAYNAPFRFAGVRAGTILAVPTEIAAVGVLYNRRLLARLHLKIPATLADFTTALAQARQAHYTAIGIGNEAGWPGDDLFDALANVLAGASSLAAEQRLNPRFSFRSRSYLRAATLIRQWADAGYFTVDFGANDSQESIDQFFQGQTLFQLVSSSEASQIVKAQQSTGIPVGIFAFPGPHGRVAPQSGYLGWVVPAAGKHRAQAIEFISEMLTQWTAGFVARQDRLPAHNGSRYVAPGWQGDVARAILSARPGIYLEAAPMAKLESTMEAVIQNLLHRRTSPAAAMSTLQDAYASRGKRGGGMAVSGEF